MTHVLLVSRLTFSSSAKLSRTLWLSLPICHLGIFQPMSQSVSFLNLLSSDMGRRRFLARMFNSFPGKFLLCRCDSQVLHRSNRNLWQPIMSQWPRFFGPSSSALWKQFHKLTFISINIYVAIIQARTHTQRHTHTHTHCCYLALEEDLQHVKDLDLQVRVRIALGPRSLVIHGF